MWQMGINSYRHWLRPCLHFRIPWAFGSSFLPEQSKRPSHFLQHGARSHRLKVVSVRSIVQGVLSANMPWQNRQTFWTMKNYEPSSAVPERKTALWVNCYRPRCVCVSSCMVVRANGLRCDGGHVSAKPSRYYDIYFWVIQNYQLIIKISFSKTIW